MEVHSAEKTQQVTYKPITCMTSEFRNLSGKKSHHPMPNMAAEFLSMLTAERVF